MTEANPAGSEWVKKNDLLDPIPIRAFRVLRG